MLTEDARCPRRFATARISGRRLFWLLLSLLGAPVLISLAIMAWEFLEAQRIWTVIRANHGYTELAPGSFTIDESYGSDHRPLFPHQVVKVSVGFHSDGENVDFSQPSHPGAQHPLAVLERLPNLAEAVVWSSRISPEGVTCLARCRRLTSLHLAAKELTANQAQPLAECGSLRDLSIDGPPVSKESLARLRDIPNLEALGFRSAQIDRAGMLELARMRNLRELCLRYTTFEESVLGELAGLPRLERLIIDSFEMSRAVYPGIGRLIGLRSLHLKKGWPEEPTRPTLHDEIPELSGLTELRELSLESGRITGAAVDTLLRFRKLETLYAESELTDDEAIRLANGLELRELVLYSPNFDDPDRICREVTRPKLYSLRWLSSSHIITSTEPR